MKLATALAERSDIQNRINTISVRLDNNAKVQEGDVPAEQRLSEKEGKGIAGFSEYRKRPCHKNDKNRDKNSQHCACDRDTENG